jgi:hypothetical protein
MRARFALPVIGALLATACAGGFLGLGVPALSEDEVAAMLSFDEYVNDSYLRRQRMSSCENHRTSYNQVERSVRAALPDTSEYVVDLVAAQRNVLRTVVATRSWARAGRIQAAFRHIEGFSPDSIEVRLWRDQDDSRPARWMVPRSGVVGTRLTALGRRVLAVTCRAR